MWYCLRKSGLTEKCVSKIQDMYDDSTTAERCAVGVTEGFALKMVLHQGSALNPCLFAMVMDSVTDEVREEAPWTMMFSEDIVICSESKEQVEEKLGSWRYALAKIRGMKMNRRKTECMCVNERQDNGSGTVNCKKRWRKWRISNTWAQLYKEMERAEELSRREYRQDGMGG